MYFFCWTKTKQRMTFKCTKCFTVVVILTHTHTCTHFTVSLSKTEIALDNVSNIRFNNISGVHPLQVAFFYFN